MEKRGLTTLSVVDDGILSRLSLKNSLSKYNQSVISDFSNAEDFLSSLKFKKPDVVLIKLNLKAMNGIEATQKIKSIYPDIKVIIISDKKDSDSFYASVSMCASAFVFNDIEAEKLAEVIRVVKFGAFWYEPDLRKVHNLAFKKPDSFDLLNLYKNNSSNIGLTRREKEVLKLLIEGKSNIEIANEMIVSINTAKAHVGNILSKMKVTDRVQAAVKAVRENIF